MFNSPSDLMKFIVANMDKNHWFTTDTISASPEEWKILNGHFEYLIKNGYIRRENLHMFTVLRDFE